MNELTTLERVDIDYTPAVLTIQNKDVLDQAVDEFISKYENIVVTEETLKDAKNSKAQVNALKKALDDKNKSAFITSHLTLLRMKSRHTFKS